MSLKAVLLQSLASAHSGDWAAAHAAIDDLSHPTAAWLHASLHREEGDESNARYWYGEAGKPFTSVSFAEERAVIARAVHALADDEPAR